MKLFARTQSESSISVIPFALQAPNSCAVVVSGLCIVLFAFLTGGGLVFGQDPPIQSLVEQLASKLENMDPNLSPDHGYCLTPEHQLERTPVPQSMRDTLMALGDMQWADQQEISEELELADFQKRELKEVMKRASDLIDDWYTVLTNNSGVLRGSRASIDSMTRESLELKLQQLEERKESLRKDMDKILLPHQWETLHTFGNRYLFLRQGATVASKYALSEDNEKVGQRETDDGRNPDSREIVQGGLTPGELESIRAVLLEKQDALREQTTKSLIAQAEAVLMLLNDEQRAEFLRLVGSPDELIIPLMELAVFQLQQLEGAHGEYVDLITEWESCEKFWEIAPSGRLEPSQSLRPASAHQLLGIAKNHLYGGMTYWGEYPINLAMTDMSQWLPDVNFTEGVDELREAFQLKLLSFQEYRDKVREVLNENSRKHLDGAFSPLTDIQKRELDSVLFRRLISMRGLHASMLNGNLGKKLKVTNSQRQQIRQQVESDLQDLVAESQEAERDIWKSILKQLPDKKAKQIRSEFVVSIDNIPGAPALVILAFDDK